MHNFMQKVTSRIHRFLHAASGGRLGNKMMGAPVLFLTTVGRKSGKEHISPLLYLADGDAMVVVASNGGYAKHPAWYHNILAQPDVQVKVNGRVIKAHAEVASGAEKARLWPQAVSMYKGYANYQEKTSRDIPVVILRPAS
jgi:deazaflavin-dependent oxidoreductase (nitroreductase family)